MREELPLVLPCGSKSALGHSQFRFHFDDWCRIPHQLLISFSDFAFILVTPQLGSNIEWFLGLRCHNTFYLYIKFDLGFPFRISWWLPLTLSQRIHVLCCNWRNRRLLLRALWLTLYHETALGIFLPARFWGSAYYWDVDAFHDFVAAFRLLWPSSRSGYCIASLCSFLIIRCHETPEVLICWVRLRHFTRSRFMVVINFQAQIFWIYLARYRLYLLLVVVDILFYSAGPHVL